MLQSTTTRPHPAVVSKTVGEQAEYLRLDPQGAAAWVRDPAFATAFASMKDAARAALRLPSTLRAFGLPLEVELDCYRDAGQAVH
jgi:hypothetical protein